MLDKTANPLYCIPCHSHINTHNTQLYVHRSGRTARAQLEGLSVLLVGPEDVHAYNNIRRILNRGRQPALVAYLSLSHHIDGSCFHDVLTPTSPTHTSHTRQWPPNFPCGSLLPCSPSWPCKASQTGCLHGTKGEEDVPGKQVGLADCQSHGDWSRRRHVSYLTCMNASLKVSILLLQSYIAGRLWVMCVPWLICVQVRAGTSCKQKRTCEASEDER